MENLPFTSFQAISRAAVGRDLVCFGAADIAMKTIRRLNRRPVASVDNNPNSWGSTFGGLPVNPPAFLLEDPNRRPFIVICSTSFGEIAQQLVGMGFVPERDFSVSPILNDLRIIAEMEGYKTRLLFTSGAVPKDEPLVGGGVYELVLDGLEWRHRKLLSGNTHGLMHFEGGFIAVDDLQGLVHFDQDFQIVRTRELPAGVRGHGIDYSELTQRFYVAAAHRDAIFVLDRDLRIVDTIPISSKLDREGKPMHHINDLCVVESSLYISMFSITGNWTRDVFDGGILEIDITRNEKTGAVITDLWMPHNILYLDGSLTVLDSLRGQLRRYNALPIGEFPGFSRGLAYDGAMFFVGQSRNRNYSKYMGLSKNISIDASIIVFDEHTKISRSLQLPPRLSEIHAIVAI